MTARRRQDPEWREFERLVARIEADAGPTGMVVKSPDRIKCRVTGRLREVDASIRTRAGTSELLITVECRRRSKKQDVTWIEQLAAKRQAIGADRTIAVSASGFSPEAEAVALQHGIALRRASEFSVADINQFLKLDFVIFWHKACALAGVGIRTFRSAESGTTPPDEFDFTLPEDTDLFAPIFRNTGDGSTWSLNDVWQEVQAALNPFGDIAKGAPPIIRTARVPYSGDVAIDHGGGTHLLGHVFLGVALWIEPEMVPLEDAQRVEYGSSEALAIQRVEFASKRTLPRDWHISLQMPKDSTDIADLRTGGNWPDSEG
ncbi:restriction endonuclease [Bradyrhizobium sp. PUT101]|uniref:restriction endonuclease n=1 Tax=Bradyrhizobium sp. PUT101 TaxID=3447427 RepID=UPI003F844D3C